MGCNGNCLRGDQQDCEGCPLEQEKPSREGIVILVAVLAAFWAVLALVLL